MKVCSKCKEEKPLSEFTKNKASKDGHFTQCKQCKRSIANAKRLANVDSMRKRDREYRANNKEAKALSDKKYREANKEKLAAQKVIYHAKNKEYLTEYAKHKRANRTEAQIEADRAKKHLNYLNETPEQFQRRKEYGMKYHKTPAGKDSARRNSANRRARILSSADGSVTKASLAQLKIDQKGQCFHCSAELDFDTPRKVHLDHYIPLSKGGLHSIDNVVWSCGHCNSTKGAKLLPKEDAQHLTV